MTDDESPGISEIQKRIETILIPRMEQLRFDRGNWNELIPVLIACSILEGAWCALRLAQDGMRLHACTVLRSLLEAGIELGRVCQDDAFVNEFRLRSEENWVKTLERAFSGNPYFSGIASHPNAGQSLIEKRNIIRDLRKKGAKRTTVRDRFVSVGAQSDYDGLYHKLSDEAHTSLSALLARYVSVDGEGVVFRAFHNLGAEDFEAFCASVDDVLDKLQAHMTHRFQERW